MNLKNLWRLQIIFLAICYSEAASAYENRQASHKQKKLIEGSTDLETEPCEDFFQYACGNWQQVFPEAGTKYHEPITTMDYNVNHELSQTFERFTKINKPKFINEAYNYYKSCTNIKKYKSANYLMWLISNDNLRNPSKNEQFDWVETLAKMRTYGFNEVFLQQTVVSRINDVKTFIIDLDKPVEDGGFQPLTENNLKDLLEGQVQITTEQFKSMWQDLAEFEEKLSELDAVEDTEFDTELNYEQTHLIEVENLPLEWLKDYLKVILDQTELDSHMKLYIQNIPYMKALDKLLQQYSQRFICSYLELRFLWYMHLNKPASFVDTDCLSSARSLMPIAMHWQYEQLHPELLEEYSSLYELFNVIRKHFNNALISNKHGFNASVIGYLQTKINHMKLRLNNVPRVDTVQTLEKYYHKLNLNSETFYENHLKLLLFNFLSHLDLLDSQAPPILDYTYLENGDIGSSSLPYLLQNANTVIVPLTLLQEPMYSRGLNDIYKFSSLGFLVAREMFYGFDDSWLLSDADGSLKYIEFEGNPLFNGSSKCLLETNPNIKSERITDIGGFRYVYQAYFGAKKETSAETIYLHDREMSPQKLFFLSFAQFFCGNLSEAFVSKAQQESVHDRLTGALSHFPEF